MAEPNDLGERAITAAQNLVRRGQEVARREGRVLRLQAQMTRLRSERQRIFYQMGQKVYDLFERDLVKNQDLRMMCQQLRGIDAEVEMKREEITQIRRPDTRGEHGIEREPDAEILDDYDRPDQE